MDMYFLSSLSFTFSNLLIYGPRKTSGAGHGPRLSLSLLYVSGIRDRSLLASQSHSEIDTDTLLLETSKISSISLYVRNGYSSMKILRR